MLVARFMPSASLPFLKLCRLCIFFLASHLLSGCTTGSDTITPESDTLETSSTNVGNESADPTGAANAPTDASKEVASDRGDASQFSIGPVEDNDLKSMLYDALKFQVINEGKSNGIETVLGELDTFAFDIVKITLRGDDVSNDPRSGADGVEVEISGWLQKTTPPDSKSDSSDEPRVTCSSFDTTVPVRKTKDSWAMPAGFVFKFSREDAEDCY